MLSSVLYPHFFFSVDKSMSPYNYYLCRSDKQTKERHVSKAHSGMKMHLIHFVDATAPIAAQALDAYKSICLKKLEITNKVINSSQSEDCLLLPSHQNLDETLSIGGHSKLEDKMDVVVTMLKDLSTKIEQQTVPSATSTASDMSNLVNELTTDKFIQSSTSCVDWSKIENIIQLTEKVKTVRFFASAENCQKVCVRYQLCFEYLSSRDNDLKKHDPMRIAEDGRSVASHIRSKTILFTWLYYILQIVLRWVIQLP